MEGKEGDVAIEITDAKGPAPISPPKTKEQLKIEYGVKVDEVDKIRKEKGANVIKEEQKSKILMFLGQFWGTMPVMIEIAMILSAVLQDFIDFAIIGAMLLINAVLGYHHEASAMAALDAVADQLADSEKIQVFRKKSGEKESTEHDVGAEDLVVGDLMYIRAGDVIPADGMWMFGDKLYVNEASLTGETRPRKVPGDDGRGDVLKGSTLVQGEGFVLIDKVGEDTMLGEAHKAMTESEVVKSPLEAAIQGAVNLIVSVTIVIVIIILIVETAVRKKDASEALLAVVGMVIAAVPVALPIVVSVTLAIGAKELAEKNAIISHLSAMQDLASMDILCSDKTGTLTTAEMTINNSKIWVNDKIKALCPGFSKEHVVELAALASNIENAQKNEIERSVFNALKEVQKAGKAELYDNYKCDTGKGDVYNGFNANVKRVYCTIRRSEDAKVTEGFPLHMKASKGLLTKVLNNNTEDDTGDAKWTVEEFKTIGPMAESVDEQFGKSGYKTLAVAVDLEGKDGEIKMIFAGILPIKDPPRPTTEPTIRNIRAALINVKMVTGDHENIAINLAKDVHLGDNFLVHEDLWPVSAERDHRVEQMDGIAQVTPKDKHEVVAVLQKLGHVVGMCGDGVNDAPALKLANVGFAVPGATQAARNAADIVLTEAPTGENLGLAVIYDAIKSSREIFQRLKAYVLYRFGSTVLIVIFLTVVILGFSGDFPPLYVILFAIVNDVTVMPIASDNVIGTKGPSELDVRIVMALSCVVGGLLSIQSIMTWWGNPFDIDGRDAQDVMTYLQLSLSSQFLIFLCRTEKPFFMTSLPCTPLIISTISAQLIISLFCGIGVIFYKAVAGYKVVYCWLYALAGLLAVDVCKCEFYRVYHNDSQTYPNLYYSWIFDLCKKKKTHNIPEINLIAAKGGRVRPGKHKGAAKGPLGIPVNAIGSQIQREKTGTYIQRSHVGNVTAEMQVYMKESIIKMERARTMRVRSDAGGGVGRFGSGGGRMSSDAQKTV
mmetsp:Transcript_21630/g.38383  ORF Transcript_21630/g.38383 Transcript_21630/m.38383 type:complete len:1003 (+) Transcript_21630:152-3160(+)|eukprot:CAMPEP_0197527762 /NCGR_PEP_ID=MMETSP1318-20131121/22709_1 /TAXON_ID=552666 /ORGANISM="Partenskyella glossopodia, Strain RCC365" /LENGTH=1002 /DNA_ID=CAMNT_0043082555 /DNA_START=84 /DNA_END=3092 /DNA_ORIENTATION=-